VALEKRSVLRRVDAATATVTDTFTGEPRDVKAAVVVDAGYRRPDDTLWQADESQPRAGDAVSPRSVYEAVLEGRRLALGLAP
jgi:2,4-dienoyl-CoA reductase (NADPH2)